MSGLTPINRLQPAGATPVGKGPVAPQPVTPAKPLTTDQVRLTPLKAQLKTANAVFARVDLNHDGTMSRQELDAATTATGFTKSEKTTIVALRQEASRIARLSDDEHFAETKGITRDDLDQLAKLPEAPTPTPSPSTRATKADTRTKAVLPGPTSAPVSAPTPARHAGERSSEPLAVTPPSTPAPGKRTLLQRLHWPEFKTKAATLWDKKIPWAHERANARQVDPTAKWTETAFTRDARAVFARVDADRNGTLSTRELTQAMADPAFKKGQAAAIGAMHRYVDDIEDLSNDERFLETRGITRDDLNQFDRLKDDSDLGKTVRGNYYWGTGKILSADRRLFAHGDASIRGTAIEQGSLGDCYFLAGVSSLAATDPAAIKRMITPNRDGTYTVTFPGRQPVTVTAPTDAEIARYASTGREGMWLNVLEKAYAKSRNDHRLFAKGDMYKGIEGGFGRQAIKTLTGQGSETRQIALLSPSQLLAKVSQAQAEGRLMTISTGHPVGRETTKANNLPTGHEYTVLGYDADSRKYRIRNPWGSGGAKNDGLLELTADEVKKNFTRLTVQRPVKR